MTGRPSPVADVGYERFLADLWGRVGGGSPPAGPVPATLDGRILRVMELLVDHYGYPVTGAAGLVGNLVIESHLQPNRVEGSRPGSPMHAPDFAGVRRTFTAQEVLGRDRATNYGPKYPGVGIAQWTHPQRRKGLFTHTVGREPGGAAILFDLDAQVDYLVTELRTSYKGVQATLRRAGVSIEDAADDVVYGFERPGSVLEKGRRLPRGDPRVQRVFTERRACARHALGVYRAAHPWPVVGW